MRLESLAHLIVSVIEKRLLRPTCRAYHRITPRRSFHCSRCAQLQSRTSQGTDPRRMPMFSRVIGRHSDQDQEDPSPSSHHSQSLLWSCHTLAAAMSLLKTDTRRQLPPATVCDGSDFRNVAIACLDLRKIESLEQDCRETAQYPER